MVASSSRLKPGERGKINVSVDIRGRTGYISKTIQVYANDPKNPVTKLAVQIYIKDLAHLNHYKATEIFSEKCRGCHVDQGKGKRGGTCSRQIVSCVTMRARILPFPQ